MQPPTNPKPNPPTDDGDYVGRRTPRIRATTRNPSRTRQQRLADLRAENPDINESLRTAERKVNELHGWQMEHDPQPPWWQRRARREWRDRWGVMP